MPLVKRVAKKRRGIVHTHPAAAGLAISLLTTLFTACRHAFFIEEQQSNQQESNPMMDLNTHTIRSMDEKHEQQVESRREYTK